jgi:Fe-Mn family superoxide dismutase
MATLTASNYQAKGFNLSGLNGISDKTLEMHFGLYQGYVNSTNKLNEEIAELIDQKKIKDPAFSELSRRLSFEYNGMVLHEYYFGNMVKDGSNVTPKFKDAAERSFGDFETWKSDFVGIGLMRGVGWAICYQDPNSGNISNHWVSLHENGNIAGFTPVLVMDVWEHAFLLDYKPADRSKYIESFFSNIDWNAVNKRLKI